MYIYVYIFVYISLCLSLSVSLAMCVHTCVRGDSRSQASSFATLHVDLFLPVMDTHKHTYSNTLYYLWSTQKHFDATHHCLREWISQSHVRCSDVELHRCASVRSRCTSPSTSVVSKGDVGFDRENTVKTERSVTHNRAVHHQIQIKWSLAKRARAVA